MTARLLAGVLLGVAVLCAATLPLWSGRRRSVEEEDRDA